MQRKLQQYCSIYGFTGIVVDIDLGPNSRIGRMKYVHTKYIGKH